MRHERWVRIVLLNFFIVALAGLVMRYKIAWSLPWVNQKHLLHAHSHFAFAGWVSLALYVAMVRFLYGSEPPRLIRNLMLGQLLSAYGMLLTFPFMGYAAASIFFSTLSILISYGFLAMLWRPLEARGEAGSWMRVGLLANAVASLGTFALAWLMQQPGFSQKWYVFSVYVYLHFQYNGWFFFSMVGLFLHHLGTVRHIDIHSWRIARQWMTVALVPALFLSALWLELPLSLYILACVAALMQLVGFWYMARAIPFRALHMESGTRLLWITAFAALGIKLMLQLLSCIPTLSHFAFGFRPLVIAYLHMVLLAMVSLYILGYFIQLGWIRNGWGIWWLWLTVMLNEAILIIQGLSAIGYIAVPHVNLMLFVNAVLLVVSVGKIYLSSGAKLPGIRQSQV